MYKLVYLPIAKEDIAKAILYIAEHLKATKAAMDLLNSIEKSILKLAEFPYSCKVYKMTNEYENEYRILPVKSYLVFYMVNEEEKTVTIYRVIYSKRDLRNIIK